MNIIPTPLAGLYAIARTPVGDDRGRFTRLFCETELAAIRPHLHFTQINQSETRRRGSVRGMHYQKSPASEAKLITCLHGKVLDVAVDLRQGSPTFLKWYALELSEDNQHAVFIPEGFAHGFQALTDQAHLLYMHTHAWTPDCEAGLRYDDPVLGIDWPLPVTAVSDRDAGFALLDAIFVGITP